MHTTRLFIHAAIEGHSRGLHFLSLVDHVTVNVDVELSVESLLSILSGVSPGAELLGHAVILCLIFQGTGIWFSYTPASNGRRPQFLHLLTKAPYLLFVCFQMIAAEVSVRWHLIVTSFALANDE